MSNNNTKVKTDIEPKFFTDKLDRHSTKHYLYFFIMPSLLLIMGLLQIMLDGILYSQADDTSGIWDYIAFSFGFWGANIGSVLGIGVAFLLISVLIPIKIRNNRMIGRIRKFMGAGFIFTVSYLILSLILLILMAPLSILLLQSNEIYILFWVKPVILVPIILNYLLYLVHILFAPPYKKVSDLIKSGYEITKLLAENSSESIIKEEDSANKETIFSIWEKVEDFFILLDKYLTSRVNFGIYNTAELTAEVVMSWTSSQKTEFQFLLTNMQEITKSIENQNIIGLKNYLEELIIQAHKSVEKYERILDFKPITKDKPKLLGLQKWTIVLTIITANLLPLIYFIFFILDRI